MELLILFMNNHYSRSHSPLWECIRGMGSHAGAWEPEQFNAPGGIKEYGIIDIVYE